MRRILTALVRRIGIGWCVPGARDPRIPPSPWLHKNSAGSSGTLEKLANDFIQSHAALFGQVLYFSTGALSAAWVLKIALCFRSGDLKQPSRRGVAWALVPSLLISAVVFRAHPPDYRVLSDEATLTSISYMMREHQTAATLYYSSSLGGKITPLKVGMDKRPPLFPGRA